MSSTASFATPERDRDFPAVGSWSVLARLPDVTEYLPPAEQPTHRHSGLGQMDYRFDPAERTAGEAPADLKPESKAIRPEAQPDAAQHLHPWHQPHLFHRASRRGVAEPVPHVESRILPRSDPFSFPATTLYDLLAPVVRFLALVALFTATGTIVLTIGKQSRTPPANTGTATTAIHPSLEPATGADMTAPMNNESINAPTASGPIGAAVDLDLSQQSMATDSEITFSVEQSDEAAPDATVDASDPEADSALPAPDTPVLDLTDGGTLPQVQTTDPPATVARLQGTIQEIPTRQAKNDDDQSSIY